MSIQSSVLSVQLGRGHIRLTKPGPDLIPFSTGPLEIYKAGNPPIITPATAPFGGTLVAPLNILLANDPTHTAKFNATLFVVMDATPVEFSASETDGLLFGAAGGTTNVAFSIRSTVPWGGKMKLKLVLKDTATGTVLQHNINETDIELYFVVSDMAPIFQQGVPYDFVKLFVYPSVITRVTATLDNWVEEVVRLCHASKQDANHPGGTAGPVLGNLQTFTPVHCYRYDTYHGGPEFTFQIGRNSFDLNRWLRYRLDPSRNLTLNCYDQARLVNCALNLGLPYHLDPPNSNITTLDIFFKGTGTAPFGWIKPLDLVGWGITNNPFFRADTTKMNLPAASPDRSSFLNHQWVCRRLAAGTSITLLALDACAGPAATVQGLGPYLTNTIDVSSDAVALSKQTGTTWGPVDNWNPSSSELIGPVVSFTDVVGLPEATAPPVNPAIKAFFDAAWSHDDLAGTDNWAVNLPNLYSALTQADFGAYQNVVQGPDPRVEVQNGVSILTFALQTPTDAAALPFFMMEIDVYTTRSAAITGAMLDASLLEKPIDQIYKAPDAAHQYGTVNLVSKDPNVNQELMVWRNIVLWLKGGAPTNVFQNIVATVVQYMKSHTTSSVTKTDAQFSLSTSTPVTANKQFSFNVTAPQAIDVSVFPQSSTVHVDPSYHSNHGAWPFTAFASTSGPTTLSVQWAEPDTYYPSSKSVNITVGSAS